MRFLSPTKGSKIVPSNRPGQLDFPAGREHFHSHLPNEFKKKIHKNKLRIAQDKQHLRAAFLKGKLEFEPWKQAASFSSAWALPFPRYIGVA